MNAKLDAEIERLAAQLRDRPMTEAELETHRRSFAYGNAVIENPRVTREMVDRAADRIGPLKLRK